MGCGLRMGRWRLECWKNRRFPQRHGHHRDLGDEYWRRRYRCGEGVVLCAPFWAMVLALCGSLWSIVMRNCLSSMLISL